MGFVRSGIISEEEEQRLEDISSFIGTDALEDEPFTYQVGFYGPKRAIIRLLDEMLKRVDSETACGRMYAGALTNWDNALTKDFERLTEDSPARFISEGRFFTGAMRVLSEDHEFEAGFEEFFRNILCLVPELEGCLAIGVDGEADTAEGRAFAGYLMYYYSAGRSSEVARAGIQVYDPADPTRHLSDGEIKEQFLQKLGRPKDYFDTLLDGVEGEMTAAAPALDDCLRTVRDRLCAV